MFVFSPIKRKFKSLAEKEIIMLKFEGFNINPDQLIYAYDVGKQNWSGIIITNSTAKDISKSIGKLVGMLYIKGSDDRGEWELTLPAARISQLDDGIIWFKHDACESIKILKKPIKSGSW